jgi:hypothetical protein
MSGVPQLRIRSQMRLAVTNYGPLHLGSFQSLELADAPPRTLVTPFSLPSGLPTLLHTYPLRASPDEGDSY